MEYHIKTKGRYHAKIKVKIPEILKSCLKKGTCKDMKRIWNVIKVTKILTNFRISDFGENSKNSHSF